MKNLSGILILVFLSACQLQQPLDASKSSGETWIGKERGSFCLEDFIDAIDPYDLSTFKCENKDDSGGRKIICTPEKIVAEPEQSIVDAGNKYVNGEFGWFNPEQNLTQARITWMKNPATGSDSYMLLISDYPNLDFKFCTDRLEKKDE